MNNIGGGQGTREGGQGKKPMFSEISDGNYVQISKDLFKDPHLVLERAMDPPRKDQIIHAMNKLAEFGA